jgi:hypothetical protein
MCIRLLTGAVFSCGNIQLIALACAWKYFLWHFHFHVDFVTMKPIDWCLSFQSASSVFSHVVLSCRVTCDIFLNLFPSLSQACYLMFPCSFVSFGILLSFLKVSMLCSFFMYSVIFCGTCLCIVSLDFFHLFWLSKLYRPYIFWSLWLPFKMSDCNTIVEY